MRLKRSQTLFPCSKMCDAQCPVVPFNMKGFLENDTIVLKGYIYMQQAFSPDSFTLLLAKQCVRYDTD